MIRPALAIGLALALGACASVPEAASHPEARAYSATADAQSDVDAALARAAASDKRVLLVMGANWCHDSRALAGWLETPRFKSLVAAHYEVVFVDVGIPQTGEGRNLDIARQLQADQVLVAWVNRVSGLILSLNYQIDDVRTGQVVARKSFGFRGDNDTSWTRAIDYMVRDLEESRR